MRKPLAKEGLCSSKISLVHHLHKSLHQVRQEGKRWSEILEPMYRSYNLQIKK